MYSKPPVILSVDGSADVQLLEHVPWTVYDDCPEGIVNDC
jgi:hypothetical protein